MSHLEAEIVHRLDDRTGAAVLLQRLAPYAGIFSTFGGITFGCTTYYIGLLEATLGHLDAAVATFADAAEIYERIGAPAHLGRTQVAWPMHCWLGAPPATPSRRRRCSKRL
jgi:hypothetical protein